MHTHADNTGVGGDVPCAYAVQLLWSCGYSRLENGVSGVLPRWPQVFLTFIHLNGRKKRKVFCRGSGSYPAKCGDPPGKCYCGSLRLLVAVLRAVSHQKQIFEFHIMTYFELLDFRSELSGDFPGK